MGSYNLSYTGTQVDNILSNAETHVASTHARTDATKTEKSNTNGNIKINGTEATVYTHPTSSGNKHIPSGGSSGQILRWSENGTAAWGSDNNTDTKVTSVGNHYTPSGGATTSASGGTLTDITNSSSGVQVVTGVTKDAAGHVTGVTSIALKSTNTDTNTDTKVTQNAVTASDYTNWRPLIIGSSNSTTEGFSPSTVTDTTYAVNTISCQPSSGTIRATAFKGTASYLSGFTNHTTTNTALDNMTNNGIWYTSSNTIPNNAASSNYDGMVTVNAYNNSWITQLYQSFRGYGMWRRTRQNGTWSNWIKIYDTANKPSASDVGLGNVGNFKAVSTVASQGLTDTEKSNARANIGAISEGDLSDAINNLASIAVFE